MYSEVYFVFYLKNPLYDFPYPPGVRRENVVRPKPKESTDETEESIVDDLLNLTESDSASFTEYITDRSHIAKPKGHFNDVTNNGNTESDNNAGPIYGSRIKATNDNGGVYLLGKPPRRSKTRNARARKKSTISKKNLRRKNLKKVQVAKQETGTQRVQVNAGYENPEITCLAQGCSGVLLKWVLTFYGTLD